MWNNLPSAKGLVRLVIVKIPIEKSIEYNIRLVWLSITMGRGSIQLRIDCRSSKLIKNISEHASATIKVHEYTNSFPIEKEIRQGDTISP